LENSDRLGISEKSRPGSAPEQSGIRPACRQAGRDVAHKTRIPLHTTFRPAGLPPNWRAAGRTA